MSNKARPTIRHVADYLGISHATVSRALNDKSSISTKTKKRVRQACAKLGYIQNRAAKTMRNSKSSAIGLIIPDIENTFYASVAKTIAQKCNSESFELILMISDDDPNRQNQHIRILRESQAAGVIITQSPLINKETLKLLDSVPIVQMLRLNDYLDEDGVTFDDEMALRLATEHLLELGHEKIAYIGGLQTLSTGKARYDGFSIAIKNHGILLKNTIRLCGSPRKEFAYKSIRKLLSLGNISAIVFGGSRLTETGVETLLEQGVSIPGDISVVGYGDPPWFKFMAGGITTIRLPVKEFALTTATRLLDKISLLNNGENIGSPPVIEVMKPSLIVRNSTAEKNKFGNPPINNGSQK